MGINMKSFTKKMPNGNLFAQGANEEKSVPAARDKYCTHMKAKAVLKRCRLHCFNQNKHLC